MVNINVYPDDEGATFPVTVVMVPNELAHTMPIQMDESALDLGGLEPGDPVKVTGDRPITGRVRKDDGWENRSPWVGLNNLHRASVGADFEEIVEANSVTPSRAEQVTLASFAPRCRPLGPRDADNFPGKLYNRLVTTTEVLWLMPEVQTAFGVMPWERHPTVVAETEPNGVVMIDDDTAFRIETQLSDPETHRDGIQGSGCWVSESWEHLRTRVFERDDYRCRAPGCTATSDTAELDIHLTLQPTGQHVVDPGTVMTLCTNCHRTAHQRRGTPIG